ncbi:TonB-dependent receptor plug domain-containing protein [Bacteroides sp.]|uniref:TonB-dependent receptor plug domain-containing protein n=1 Tax=Bacteroides sp. TaxID=29523 RepID=UPI002FC7EECC
MKGFLLCFFLLLPVIAPAQNDTVFLKLYTDSVALKEIVVKAAKTPRANSRWSDMQPLDLVTIGGANGNLYQALQTLPGTQVEGESGRLLVRGGSSSETQTYIDGMHVLNPYTTTGTDVPARGRYSTFMFSGVNLATGGASQEYGQALSAVLPLETKDTSPFNKIGMNLSTVGLGGGGTRSFDTGSFSLHLDYQNLSPYNRLFPGRVDFVKPYELFSTAAQFRYTPDERTVFKCYIGYDRTGFSHRIGEVSPRIFALGENNIYLNSTFRRRTLSGWNWFAGAAYSFYNQQVGGAVTGADQWSEQQQEWHLKTKLFRRFNPFIRVDMGIESFLRGYESRYQYQTVDDTQVMHPSVTAAFLSATLYPVEAWKAEVSVRAEYTGLNRQMNVSPRLAISYQWSELLFSATVGRYTQLPENRYLLKQSGLLSETCWQYNIGVQYEHSGRFYKVELYNKRYDRLALSVPLLTSDGYGSSKGIDLFFRDVTLWRNLEYQLAYSFNRSLRKYREYTELTTPSYATRHNASLVLKYAIPRLHTIIGLTNCFASGRPFHNPDRAGLMNDEAKPYNSLDLGITYLFSKKVILHASASNILGRKNEFGRIDGRSVRPPKDHSFYLGLFITLGKKVAYDVSNF